MKRVGKFIKWAAKYGAAAAVGAHLHGLFRPQPAPIVVNNQVDNPFEGLRFIDPVEYEGDESSFDDSPIPDTLEGRALYARNR